MTEALYSKIQNEPQWQDGMDACEAGMTREANPYPKDTIRWRSWDLGWKEMNDIQTDECD